MITPQQNALNNRLGSNPVRNALSNFVNNWQDRNKKNQIGVRSQFGQNAPVGTTGGFDYAKQKIIPSASTQSSEPGSMSSYTNPSTPASAALHASSGLNYEGPSALNVPVGSNHTITHDATTGTTTITSPIGGSSTSTPSLPPLASQTSQNQDLTYPNAIRTGYAAGQFTPQELQGMDYINNATQLNQAYKNTAALGGYAPQPGFDPNNPNQTPLTPAQIASQMARPDLEGRAAPINAELGAAGNIFGTANLAGAQAYLQGAQNQATRAQTAAQGGINATAPVLGSAGQLPFNPATGTTGQFLGGAGGPFQAGVISGNQALGQSYSEMNAASQAASGIKNTIQQYISSNPTINPSEFTDVNRALQFLNGRASNPQYQTLSNYLSEYISTLAPILGVGGDTTNLKTEIAQSMVNAQASGQSISQVLDNIENLAQTKLNAIRNAGQGGNPPQYNSSGSTGGGTTGNAINTPYGNINPNL